MDTITSLLSSVRLSSDDLFSKWGFQDGDVLYETLDDHYAGPRRLPEDSGHSFAHAVLVHLVRKYLLPQCPTDNVFEICTIHNPIRYENEVDRFPEVTVWAPREDVLAAAAEVDRG